MTHGFSARIAKLKSSITLYTGMCIILFIASLIMIVMQASIIVWAITLGLAVLLRLFIVNPYRARFAELKAQQYKQDIANERNAAFISFQKALYDDKSDHPNISRK